MIQEQLELLRSEIPDNVTLIAVSKTKPLSDLQAAYDAGQRHFGENKVQEMVEKAAQLPKDIHWHLIGHLQSNKVKYMAGFVHLIHGVDSLKLLQEIDKQAQKAGRIQDVLLQFHIAQEETKFGLELQEANEILESELFKQLKCIRICGVMGMASFTSDVQQIANEFQGLKKVFETLKGQYFPDATYFKEISMGMSGDYPIAIQNGSTMVRVGSKIFGGR
ncbi:MAG: YggS family pyridoxal phosphate-dependent enzyme [Flavobacteriia bacterium]|jgi:pyridoxal phosphate enzyme (YggS family)|nr:YggS family pyridoxal phosphate-dependent enzyme [Flavobacteriia bacterium]